MQRGLDLKRGEELCSLRNKNASVISSKWHFYDASCGLETARAAWTTF